MSSSDERGRVHDPQAHVDAVAQDEAHRAKDLDKGKGREEKGYGLVDHGEVALVDGGAVGGGVGVALGDPVDPEEEDGDAVGPHEDHGQGLGQLGTAVQPQERGRVGLAKDEDDESDGHDHRAEVGQDGDALEDFRLLR